MFYLTSRLYDLEVRGSRPNSSASKGMLEAVGDIAILLLPSHTLPFLPPPPHSHTLEYQSIARLPSSPLVSCQVCLTVAGSHDDSER